VGQIAELGRGFPGRVEAADQGPHAGARDVVDGDVVRFEPLQHADMGQAVSAPALEGDADGGPPGRCTVVRAGGRRVRGHQQEGGEDT
jgi:hypothetical protein